jgi:hypothetical protein
MSNFHLGKKPARENAVKFGLLRYLGEREALPTAPPVFGHLDAVPEWGMLANDQCGDCVLAGFDHETLYWLLTAGGSVQFIDQNALDDYSAITGFDPAQTTVDGSNPTDQGTDMEEAAAYRRKTGVVDAFGKRHRIGAYIALPGVSARGNNDLSFLDNLANAAYAFGAVGVGIEFPASAWEQFDRDWAWDVVENSPIEGGHYIPIIGRAANGNFLAITWGRVVEITPAFLLKYTDEAIVSLSTEFLDGAGRTVEGFDLAALNRDLAALGGEPVEAEAPAFPLTDVQPWLRSRVYTAKGRAAQAAIRAWLTTGGK